LFQCWRVRIIFAHRVTGLPGCWVVAGLLGCSWVAVIFNHPSGWAADRVRGILDGPAAIVTGPGVCVELVM